MTGYIVRNNASSIMFGGLERLFIYFSDTPPVFSYQRFKHGHTDSSPFEPEHHDSMGLYVPSGWQHHRLKRGIHPVSVGSWLGYSEEGNSHKHLTTWIWNKLCEHFHNAPFETWPELEKRGLSRQEDFIIKLNFKVYLRDGTN